MLYKHCFGCTSGDSLAGHSSECTHEHGHQLDCICDRSEVPTQSIEAITEPSSMQTLMRQKVVVMFEVKPLSDRFQQIMLPQDGLTSVLSAMESYFPRMENNSFVVVTNPKHDIVLPDIVDYYEQDAITAQLKRGPNY